MIVLCFYSSKQTAFVLLDLIGASNPVFYNSFKETNDLFERMQLIGMYNNYVLYFGLVDQFFNIYDNTMSFILICSTCL